MPTINQKHSNLVMIKGTRTLFSAGILALLGIAMAVASDWAISRVSVSRITKIVLWICSLARFAFIIRPTRFSSANCCRLLVALLCVLKICPFFILWIFSLHGKGWILE
jgi:hypothetical protein